MSNARTLADYANDDAISGDKIHGGTISGVTLSSPTINTPTFANDAISGDKIHGGTISNSALATTVTMSANHPAVKTALNASGNPPIYACRAWVNFDGINGANNSYRGAGNAYVADLGTGYYRIYFNTAMPDTNYCANVLGYRHSNYGDGGAFQINTAIQSMATDNILIRTYYHIPNYLASQDVLYLMCSIHR